MLNIIKKYIYRMYKKLDHNRFICTLAYIIYNTYSWIRKKECRGFLYKRRINSYQYQSGVKKPLNKLVIAIICDDMTFKSFQDECELLFLTPNNWFRVMEEKKPDLFFCESAWSGIKKYRDCWRGKIYRNEKLFVENRKDLLSILHYCSKAKIKTVFWNKEDPIYFDDRNYNFADTAKRFDYVFTTASECIEKYLQLGCKHVNVLEFGFSPKLYNPINSTNKKNEAVFAGSWYLEHEERCHDMKKIFHTVLDRGIQLTIYDRNYGTNNYKKAYPKEYSQYCKASIPYEQLGHVYKSVRYGININTIKNSDTMFARRVYEMLACNTCIISNESQGMKKIFGDNIWFIGEEFNYEKINEYNKKNLLLVLKNHTNQHRLMEIMDATKINYKLSIPRIAFLYKSFDHEFWLECSEKWNYQIEHAYYLDYADHCVVNKNRDRTKLEVFESMYEYFVLVDESISDMINCEEALLHYSYLEEDSAIALGIPNYTFVENSKNYNVILPMKYLTNIVCDTNIMIKKYMI